MNCIMFTKINTMKNKRYKYKKQKEIWLQKIETCWWLWVRDSRRRKNQSDQKPDKREPSKKSTKNWYEWI